VPIVFYAISKKKSIIKLYSFLLSQYKKNKINLEQIDDYVIFISIYIFWLDLNLENLDFHIKIYTSFMS
jgi:hypothetical protein